jgi:hypothetical protein
MRVVRLGWSAKKGIARCYSPQERPVILCSAQASQLVRLSTTRQRYGGDASMLDNWRMWAVPDLCFRSVREDASCTTFSASDALPTSQRARLYAASKSGRAIRPKLHFLSLLDGGNPDAPSCTPSGDISRQTSKFPPSRSCAPKVICPGIFTLHLRSRRQFRVPADRGEQNEQPLRRRRSAVPKNARGAGIS